MTRKKDQEKPTAAFSKTAESRINNISPTKEGEIRNIVEESGLSVSALVTIRTRSKATSNIGREFTVLVERCAPGKQKNIPGMVQKIRVALGQAEINYEVTSDTPAKAPKAKKVKGRGLRPARR